MSRVTILNYLEAISEIKKNSYKQISLPQNIYINNHSYLLEKQSSTDELLFLAKDDHDEEYFIECIPASLSDISAYERRFIELTGLIQRFGVTKSYGVFQSSFVIATKADIRITLDEFNFFKSCLEIPKAIRDQAKLALETIVKITRELGKNLFYAKKIGLGIGNISPETMCFELVKNPQNPIVMLGERGIEVKIDMINKSFLTQEYLKFPNIFPYEYKDILDLWGAGVCLYCAKDSLLIDEVPFFAIMDQSDRSNVIMESNYQPGISELIVEMLCKNRHNPQYEKLFHNLTKTWDFLLSDTCLTLPDQFEVKALFASFYFEDKSARNKGFEALFSRENETVRMFNASPHRVEVISKAIKIFSNYEDHDSNHYIYNNALSTLNGLIITHSWIKQKAGSLGIYRLLKDKVGISNGKIRKEIINFLILICKENTLTGLILAKKKGVIRELLYPQYLKESNSLIPLLSLCEVKKIKLHFDFKVIEGENNKIQALANIPIHFKRQRPEFLLDLVQSIMNPMVEVPTLHLDFHSCLQSSLEIIYEILFKSKQDQEINRSGECCKLFNIQYQENDGECCKLSATDYQYNSFPLIVTCSECQKQFCLTCSRFHASTYKNHIMKYILYPQPSKSMCSCSNSHDHIIYPSVLCELKEYTNLMLFASHGTQNKYNFSSDDVSEEINITSTTEIIIYNDDINPITIFYYEIEIKSAGWSEDIKIGIDGTGIEYHGNTGNILHNDKSIAYGPRFGTKDTVGIGITSSYVVYFTYNGYNLHIYFPCDPIREIRPLIKLKGENISIQVKFSNFSIDSRSYPVIPPNKIASIIQDIENWINYYVYMLVPYPRIGANKDQIYSILRDLSSQLPISFPSFNNSFRRSRRHESCLLM
ncbi:unnamed protein product [Blepharisma stoltei]|uniref:B30.2/SPRY domain-containing protein n=1 Tax=Blepharisma stoltei TaxID=1481888 RepID=A0AAU9IR88_9CILI|nr:unnamed protein product [Blepharisma stoltei]